MWFRIRNAVLKKPWSFVRGYVRDTYCVVAVTACRREEAISRHCCGSPRSSRSSSVGLLDTHSASMDGPSGAVLFAYFGFFLSCSWFLASHIQCPCCLSIVLNHSIFCVASASWIMSCSLHSSNPLVVCSNFLPFSLRRRTFWRLFLQSFASVLVPLLHLIILWQRWFFFNRKACIPRSQQCPSLWCSLGQGKIPSYHAPYKFSLLRRKVIQNRYIIGEFKLKVFFFFLRLNPPEEAFQPGTVYRQILIGT